MAQLQLEPIIQPGSLLSKAVDELPSKPNLHYNPSTTPWGEELPNKPSPIIHPLPSMSKFLNRCPKCHRRRGLDVICKHSLRKFTIATKFNES